MLQKKKASSKYYRVVVCVLCNSTAPTIVSILSIFMTVSMYTHLDKIAQVDSSVNNEGILVP